MEVLDGIEKAVKTMDVRYIRIDGSVATEKRHIHVNTFQNDTQCMVAILSITACATGLTLTKASTVVFAEMHFTPAVMIQAEDRAHRIGQEGNCVNVHYLYGTDTVDEIIFPKLREKFAVVTTTLDDKRMDMDVQKLKSGCVGDIDLVHGRNNESTDSIKLQINKRGKSSEKKRPNTIMDYFKKANKSSTCETGLEVRDNAEKCNNIEDDFDIPIEGAWENGSKDKEDSDEMLYNLHDSINKRNRSQVDEM